MKFFLEKTKNAGHCVTIHIPKITIDNTLNQEFYKINQKTSINGFRKGKIPIKIIQEKHGNRIYYDVFNKLMQKFFFNFLKKENINIIGYPKYNIIEQEEKNEFFKYSVTYEVYPNIKLKDLRLIEVEKIIVHLTNEDIKKNIILHQKEEIAWYEVNRSIKINDRVTINYSIYEKNKKIKKFDSKNIKLIIFKNHFLNELNHKLINHYTNDVIFLKIFFSSFHPEIELKNKNIIFKIKIIKVEEKKEELINEDIENIKSIELNFESIKNKIVQDTHKLTQNYLKNQIIEKLIKINPVKIPVLLLQEEIKVLQKKLIEEYKTKNILDKKYHIDLKLNAKKQLCAKLILEKIIHDNNIFVDDTQIKETLKELSLKYKKPSEIIKIYNNNKMLRKIILEWKLEQEVIKFLKNKIKIIEKKYTFNEFIYYSVNHTEELFF